MTRRQDPRGARDEIMGDDASPRVIVVGSGVSGCACAAILASRGIHVTAMNSVLDSVGLPGYGPELAADADSWEEIGNILADLPAPLCQAWLNAAWLPDDGSAFVVVDRRAVSVETKRALESMPGLEFRQGLVTAVRPLPVDAADRPFRMGRRVAVETFFGEIFEADAVVLAVGLALGGRTEVGTQVIPGGRYGEIPADALRDELLGMGATFSQSTLEVGERFARGCLPSLSMWPLSAGQAIRIATLARTVLDESRTTSELATCGALLQSLIERRAGDSTAETRTGPMAEPTSAQLWNRDYPRSVHWHEAPERIEIISQPPGRAGGALVVCPDGVATAEVYVANKATPLTPGDLPGDPDSNASDPRLASRSAHKVRGLVVTSIDPSGRLVMRNFEDSRIWVSGRAAGAKTYLGSLRSGVRVGEAVAAALAAPRFGDPSTAAASPGPAAKTYRGRRAAAAPAEPGAPRADFGAGSHFPGCRPAEKGQG